MQYSKIARFVEEIAMSSDEQSFIFSLLHQFSHSLGAAIDARDSHTWSHSEDVSDVSSLIAKTMGFTLEQVNYINIAGHLHDIGKIGIPDEVLFKSGKLTEEEMNIMRLHPLIGARILGSVQIFNTSGITMMVRHHHERFDGKGYPDKLCAEKIPLGSRVLAVADSLSAMIQDRPYRSGRSFGAAVREILNCAGTQFDPMVVSAFHQSQEDIRRIYACGRLEPGNKKYSLGA